MALELRCPTVDEYDAFRRSLLSTFGADPDADPAGPERLRALIEPDRIWAAFDGREIVATAATFALRLTVPGGELPMAGLTVVSVRPTHRRRGLMRALVQRHLDDARAHREPVSGLWASEASIYTRFGYGVAAHVDTLDLDVRGRTPAEVAPGAPVDDVAFADDETVLATLPPLYDAIHRTRAGMVSRTPAWWRLRRVADNALWRGGATARHHVIAWRDGVATGWVAFRQRSSWRDGLADGAVEIEELVAVDGRAEASLWRFATTVDLFPRVHYTYAPVDAALPWLIADARRVVRRRSDSLHLRIDDVATALAARRYAADGALRIEVRDEPGTPGYALTIEGGAARCVRDDAAPDLSMDRATLGSIYLGGVAPSLLARAGRLQGTPAALRLADRAFSADAPPWCVEVF
jgi:predicted acetyltransferase